MSVFGQFRVRVAAGLILALVGCILFAGYRAGWFESERKPPVMVVSIQVVNEQGPVGGAHVFLAGQREIGITGDDGLMSFPLLDESSVLSIFKEGYQITATPARVAGGITFLRRLPKHDHEDYRWQEPTTGSPWKKYKSCGECHGSLYEEWRTSRHSLGMMNPHFVALTGEAQDGWSLRRDRPDGIAVCASCHSPTSEVGDHLTDNPKERSEGELAGVHCDYCHKIVAPAPGDVGLAHGRFGLQLLRPSQSSDHLFFGPRRDSSRDGNAFSRFQRESRLCASCHEGTIFGVAAYTTFSEWQASPSAALGVQCQDCHMKPTGKIKNVAPADGGVERDPHTIGNHRFFAGSQAEMLRASVTATVTANREAAGIRVRVHVSANGVGHRVPTGSIDRNMVLTIEARDGTHAALLPLEGGRLPDFACTLPGPLAGKLYAKVAHDFDGKAPVPFWRAAPEVADTRLRPDQPDEATWLFPSSTRQLRVRVIHRRFWPQVAAMKKFADNETVILEKDLTISDAAPP